MDVLRALEKAVLNIKPGELEGVSRWESWEAGQNA